MARVLVVDDDRRLAELVASVLSREGYETEVAVDGQDALRRAAVRPPDVILLDLEMPGMNGMRVLDALRQPDGSTKFPTVIFTGGRTTASDEVMGFHRGAVDFVTKGADTAVLLARIENALRHRRSQSTPKTLPPITVGRLRIDVSASRVQLEDREIELENRQFSLLCYLAERPGIVVTRGELLEAVWGTTYVGFQHAVDQAVYEIRKRLGSPRWIETIPRRGYRFARS